MLQRIRDNASGPFAYVVVGLISLVFGVWGIGSYLTPSADPVVASVGNTEITTYQLKQAYNQRYRQLRARLGDGFDPSQINPRQLRQSILQQLIQSAVLDQYAKDAGYRTTDSALLQALQSEPQFQANGKFSTQRYHNQLANAGLDAATFEARMRRDMLSRQVQGGLAGTAFTVPIGVEHAYSLQHQQRKVDYLIFAADHYTSQVKVSPDDVKDWYQQHAERYMRPERVKLSYVQLDRNALKVPDDVVSQDALHELYEQDKAQFSSPDKRDAQALFLPVTANDADAARQQIQELASQVDQGQDFAAVAQASDGDVQFKQLDGVTRGDVPSALAQVLFSQSQGAVSAPVRTDKGWYLVKTTAKHPGKTSPFDAPDVQKQLKNKAQQQWRNKQFSSLSEQMQSLAFQAPNDLETLSDKLDLKIQTSDWMTADAGEHLGQYKAVRKAAFSDDVLDEGLNSSAIEIGKGRLVVVRVAQHERPQEIPLAQVKDKIRDDLATHKAQQLADKAAQAAQAQLSQGKALAAVAQAANAKLQQPGYIERSSDDVPAAVRRAAFALSVPAQGKMSYKVTQTADDNAVLVALAGVKTAKAGDQGTIDQRFVQGERMYLARAEYTAFIDYLNEHADVKINQDKLDSLE